LKNTDKCKSTGKQLKKCITKQNMREAFPPSLPLSSSGIENNNNKEYNNNNNNCCYKEKDINIDRNNEITKDIPINETENLCFDTDEGKTCACN
jgi:hypothetical protein